MARFRFRRRRFGRRRFYRRRRFGRKQRVINASSRSRCRVKVRAERFLEFQVVHGDYHGGVLCINPFIEQSQESQIVGAIPAPRYTSLIETKIFRYYSRLYEEFKLDYMKVNIMGITPVGATAQLEGITFTTAWDRRMIPAEFNTAGYPSPTDISDSPSSQQVTCINNSVIKFKRMIRPSDLLEKIAWYPVDTKYGSLPMKGVTTNATALSFYVDAGVYQPIPFCPAFYMVMNTPTTPGQGTTYQYKFRVEVTYYVTFRNPRFGQASVSTRADPRALPDAPDDDDGGMDDDAGNNDALRHVRFGPDDSDSDDDNFTRPDDNETLSDNESAAAVDELPPQENAGAATAAAATAALPREPNAYHVAHHDPSLALKR